MKCRKIKCLNALVIQLFSIPVSLLKLIFANVTALGNNMNPSVKLPHQKFPFSK